MAKKVKRSSKKHSYLGRRAHKQKQHLWLALLIGFAVVAFWRGAWGLMDLYLFPNHSALSFVVSLVIGFVILYATHYIIKELTGD